MDPHIPLFVSRKLILCTPLLFSSPRMIFSQFSFCLFLTCLFLILSFLFFNTVGLGTLFTCSLSGFSTDSIHLFNCTQPIIVLGAFLSYKGTPALEAVSSRSCSHIHRQQTCLSDLPMRCKTANKRQSRQTGKNKNQSNSTSRALHSSHCSGKRGR